MLNYFHLHASQDAKEVILHLQPNLTPCFDTLSP